VSAQRGHNGRPYVGYFQGRFQGRRHGLKVRVDMVRRFVQSPKLITRRRVLTLMIVVFGVPILLSALAAFYLWRYSPINREWVVRTLEKRYQCQVELKSFRASFYPAVSITGEGLVLRRREPPDLPPVATVQKFSATGLWPELLRQPRHFGRVRLDGLRVVVPPRTKRAETKKQEKAATTTAFILDEILADDATLQILSSNPGKPPHEFIIHKLRMKSVGRNQPMSFDVTLTNPVPVGEIQSRGKFGPWNSDDPSLTAVSGSYTFSNADLSTIHGLGGTLTSLGKYEGVLSEIRIQGETDTPDFDLGISGHKVPLKTQFSAVVDGVSGDTILDPVEAQLLSSKIVARGRVARVPEGKGRYILLAVSAGPARLEDLLRLAVNSSTPSLTGALNVQTKFDLHPGEETVAKRLKLDGTFTVRSARFTDPDTEAKINSLSRHGQGKPRDPTIQNTVFDLQGRFVSAKSEANFSNLSFSLPGAALQLQGGFGLATQALDFHGTLRLQAKVSQLTTGIKSLLLKPVDRLFEREGAGTVLPIEITGTRQEPSFHVDFRKALKMQD